MNADYHFLKGKPNISESWRYQVLFDPIDIRFQEFKDVFPFETVSHYAAPALLELTIQRDSLNLQLTEIYWD